MDTGPALPPHLAKKLNTDRKEKNENEEKQSCTDMSTKQQGEKSSSAHSEDSADSDECESYGPTLPPGFQKRKENVPSRTRVLGPMRPADYPRTVTSSGLFRNMRLHSLMQTREKVWENSSVSVCIRLSDSCPVVIYLIFG